MVIGVRETTLATQQVGKDLEDPRHSGWLESQNATVECETEQVSGDET
jgi:hypothetical protein